MHNSRVVPAAEELCLPRALVGHLELNHVLHSLRCESSCSCKGAVSFFSLTSLPALTRVSVPCTGSAATSVIQKVWSRTLPYMTPMISYCPPERAWMAYEVSNNGSVSGRDTHHLDERDGRDLDGLEVVRATRVRNSTPPNSCHHQRTLGSMALRSRAAARRRGRRGRRTRPCSTAGKGVSRPAQEDCRIASHPNVVVDLECASSCTLHGCWMTVELRDN